MPNARKKSRNSKGFVALPISGNLALGTLGNVTVIFADVFGAPLTEDFYAISSDIAAQIIELTAGEGDPLMCGFSHGDYSVTEVKEALEVKLLGPGNKIEQERTRRLTRKIGIFMADVLSHTTMKLFGRGGAGLIRTKMRFVLQSGKTLNLYVYNNSGATLTTGAIVKFQGTIYGRWIL